MPFKRKRSYSAPGSRKRFKTTFRGRRFTYRKRRTPRYKRSARYTRPTKYINTKCVGLPRVMITQMSYRVADQLVTGALGVGSYRSYNLMSLYDPEVAVGGGQPRYYDQLLGNGLYSGYVVYKIAYEVKFRNRSAEDFMVGVAIGLDSVWPTAQDPVTFFKSGELPRIKTRALSSATDGGSTHIWTTKGVIYPHQLLGVTKTAYYADSVNYGSTTTNPVNAVYLKVGQADDPLQSQTGLTTDVEIYFKFYVKLTANQMDPPIS